MSSKFWVDPVVRRDPARIKQVLSLVGQVWKTVPDYRLGQLICVLTPAGMDPFYLEDEKLKELLQIELDGRVAEASNAPDDLLKLINSSKLPEWFKNLLNRPEMMRKYRSLPFSLQMGCLLVCDRATQPIKWKDAWAAAENIWTEVGNEEITDVVVIEGKKTKIAEHFQETANREYARRQWAMICSLVVMFQEEQWTIEDTATFLNIDPEQVIDILPMDHSSGRAVKMDGIH